MERDKYCVNEVGSVITKHSYILKKCGVSPGKMINTSTAQALMEDFHERNPEFKFKEVPENMWQDFEELYSLVSKNVDDPEVYLNMLLDFKSRSSLRKGDYTINIPVVI